jgi:hypothetical protein
MFEGASRWQAALTLRKYVGMTGAARATAWRDINDLLGKSLILPGGVGRATYYNPRDPGMGVVAASNNVRRPMAAVGYRRMSRSISW